ncbi:MAG: hypothetical protein LC687_02180 [Actinobacteria bacterium]|nr:hypothetical protein [Actinomycetota bacterium]
MSLRQALNLAWYFLTKDGSKKGIDQLRADLLRPLPGMTEEVSEDVVSGELALFQKSMKIKSK